MSFPEQSGRRTLLQCLSAVLLLPWHAWAAARQKPETIVSGIDEVQQALQVHPAQPSSDIEIIAPASAIDGELVQIQVMSRVAHTEAIAIFAEKNPVPLVANFTFSYGARPCIVTRIKLAESQNIEVAVKAGERYYQAVHFIAVRSELSANV